MSYYTKFAIYCECDNEENKLELLNFINDYDKIDEIKKDISELNINNSFDGFYNNKKDNFIINFEFNIYHYGNLVDFLRDLIGKLDEMFQYEKVYFESAIIGEEIDDNSYNYGEKEVILFYRTITIDEKLLWFYMKTAIYFYQIVI